MIVRPHLPRTAAGFTLIEVLVTIFVTAVGLLTVAGLQAASKKVTYEATQRTTATALAQDMVERMRANALAKDSYVTSDATAAVAGSNCAAADAACSSSALAGYDLYQWGQKLLGAEEQDASGRASGGLVNPTGCIRHDSSTGLYRVVIAWRGLSSIGADDSARDACGKGLGRYSDPKTGEVEKMRRLIVVEFI